MEGTIGEIRLFAGNFAPRTWAFCEGQLLPIASNTALFSIVGTIYGGDGRTTFGLPSLRGRMVIGPGTGPGLPSYREGQKGGQTEVTLNVNQLPQHNHNFSPPASTSDATTPKPEGNFPAQTGTPSYHSTADATEGGGNTASTGGGQAHDNMMPYVTLRWIICLQGIYPSRS